MTYQSNISITHNELSIQYRKTKKQRIDNKQKPLSSILFVSQKRLILFPFQHTALSASVTKLTGSGDDMRHEGEYQHFLHIFVTT